MKPKTSTIRILCPFHEEKTPSCILRTDINYFKCFGCGKHGKLNEILHLLENTIIGDEIYSDEQFWEEHKN